ncbi:MAG: spore maturation protein [Gammaproteobacteria bacterium]|nr:spore maturation protein [Gammaproteobacteria bacterium]
MLSRVWLGLLLAALTTTLVKTALGDAGAAAGLTAALFASAKLAVEVAIGLVGMLCLWLGIARIAEGCGAIPWLARKASPLFRCIMPGVPAGDPAIASVTMNLAANVLGLDNAATPLGIKAMHDLQRLNPDPQRATDAQIMFIVLNASSVTLFPVTVFMYRAQQGAAQPTDVFVPILLATVASTLAGFLSVAMMQRLPLWRWPILLTLGVVMALTMGALAWVSMAGADVASQSALLANLALLGLLVAIFGAALKQRVAAFDLFIEGAKEGFNTALTILPYLVAMLVAVALFRASGLLDWLLDGVRWLCQLLAVDSRFVDALPVSLTKTLSGSGARAMMLDVMQTQGVDSFAGRLAAIMQGSSETTFYVIAVYFGAVGVTRIRHALGCSLLADLAGMLAAILVCYLFFG